MQQLRNSAVPAEFHVLCLYQWLVVDLRGPQLVPAVHQDHPFGDTAQKQGVAGGGIPAAHHGDRFALVAHPVAGGTVGHTPAHQGLLACKAQLPGIGSGGKDYRPGIKGPLAGLQRLGGSGQLHALHLCVRCLRTEPLCLPLHLLRQGEAVDPVLIAGIVVDLLRQGHLPACREFLQHQCIQPGPGCIERRLPPSLIADTLRVKNYAVHIKNNCFHAVPPVGKNSDTFIITESTSFCQYEKAAGA